MPLQRAKLIGIAAGVLFSGTLAAAAHYWVGHYIDGQGQEEVFDSARRAIWLAERRVDRVVSGLNELTNRRLEPCSPAHIEAMQELVFAVTPVKELSVLGPDGRTLCTNLGAAVGQRRVVSTPDAKSSGIALEVIRVTDRIEPMVRVCREISSDGTKLAALMPGDLFIAQAAVRGSPNAAYGYITTRDGTLIAEAGTKVADGEPREERIVAQHRSEKYGLMGTVSISSAALAANYANFRSFASIGTTALVVLLIAASALVPWRRRNDPIAAIERALAKNEFVPYYQPIVDIKSGRVVGAEVLLRWRKPNGTLVSPVDFVPLAESTDLILDLTDALMRGVCREMGDPIGRRPHFKISFNLAARHFRNDRVVGEVRDIFDGSRIRLSQVVLELTERRPLDNLTAARRVIAGLQGLGCQVAIDDVGAGHGGFSYLLKLGVDVIKIDKLFIDAIGSERYSETIIETMVDLARSMRMDIVAEGVESFEQVAYLRDHGIHKAQGYVFSPPLPGSSFRRLLEAIDPVGAEVDGPVAAPVLASLRPGKRRGVAA